MIDALLDESEKLKSDLDATLADADLMKSLATFVGLVRRLRLECPWDMEQTHESVKGLLIEETYETVEAIAGGDLEELRKELGDLFLHVLFHGAIAEEHGEFSIKDIADAAIEKLYTRHPHVYGDKNVDGTSDVLKNWEQIKLKEGKRKNLLDGVPSSMPGLLRAHRIQEKVAGVGFDFPNSNDCWQKVEEELGEVRDAMKKEDHQSTKEEIGDLLFSIVNFARQEGIHSEDAIQTTNRKFSDRFEFVERRVTENSQVLGEVHLDILDEYWNEAKNRYDEL